MTSTGEKKTPIQLGNDSCAGRSVSAAIQGELGSNSHLAVLQAIGEPGHLPTIVPCRTLGGALRKVVEGAVDCAILPIENSLHGAVAELYDELLHHPVRVTGESYLRIRLDVLGLPGALLDGVRRVLSHPVALNQCRRWFAGHTQCEPVPFYDTAGAVKEIMRQQDSSAAAIAPSIAGKEYGAETLASGVEDSLQNITRFLRIERRDSALGRDVSEGLCMIAFQPSDGSSALSDILSDFREAGLEMIRLTARPIAERPWVYTFHAEARFRSRDQVHQFMGWLAGTSEKMHLYGLFPEQVFLEPQSKA